MSRNDYTLLDCGIEEEIDPKIKFNSLLSVTVSTAMCLAAKCPLPKSNVETTRLFLSTITDENGETPRNIKGFLSVLNNYSGPYESDSLNNEKRFEKAIAEKPQRDKECNKTETESMFKSSASQVLNRETPLTDGQTPTKRVPKSGVRKTEKETGKKLTKSLGSKVSTSKSLIAKL